jgi:HlyD family secretion protein
MRIVEVIKERTALLVLVALGAGVFGYEWHQATKGPLIANAAAKPSAQPPTQILAEGRIATYPGADVIVGSELGGKLKRIHVKELDVVKAGDMLFEVDVKEQRAALAEANARVGEVSTDVAHLKRERGRSAKLFRDNVLPEAEFEKTTFATRGAEHRRASLLASVARLSAIVEKAKVTAPIAGTVTQRYADEGEILAPGAPLFSIADLSKLRVEAEVGEFDAGRVRIGAKATLRAEGYDGKSWQATVEEIPDRVQARELKPLDPSRPVDTRVLLVKLRLAEKVPLKLGQRVDVEIER